MPGLAAPAVYVDQAGDFTPADPVAGTAVTWKPGTPDAVTGLTDLLATLADNGGPTLTHALIPGSPAMNAGDDDFIPAGLTTDQRGFPRVTFNIVRLEIVGETATIVAAGIPGLSYRVDRSENLTDWEPLGQGMICPESGIMNFPDPGPLPASRFYRVVGARQ